MKNQCYIVSENTVWKEINGEVYILDAEHEEILSLNETASYIWKMLTDRQPTNRIEEKISEIYDISHDQAVKDIQEIIKTYKLKGLLKVGKSKK